MDVVDFEYNNYWETKMFFEELDSSWGFDEALSGYHESSSPEVPTSSSGSPATTTKNIAVERNRRRKLNESLYTLRSVVPNITKMDKASIIKDAIDYVQALQEEERRMMAELATLEATRDEKSSMSEITEDDGLVLNKRGKKRIRTSFSSHGSPTKRSIEITELSVRDVGERTVVISITCNKRNDSAMEVCEILETLNLKIISANITSICGSLLHTLFVEGDDINSIQLKQKIEAAITKCDVITSPTSSISFFSED